MQTNIEFYTYFGSQCAILKSKLNLVTNISLSNLTSWTLGGGRAMATPIKPITEDEPDVPEEAANPEEEWCWFEDDDDDDWLCELFDELDLFLETLHPLLLFPAGLNLRTR